MAIQYIKRNSFLHDLDARTKLLIFVCTAAATIIVEEPILLVLLFIVLYILGRKAVEKNTFNNNLKALITMFLTFGMFQVIFSNAKDTNILFYLIPGKNLVPITVQGLFSGVTAFFRLFCVVLSMQIMLYTTPPVEMALTITERGNKRSFWASVCITLILGGFFFLALRPIMSNNSLSQRLGSISMQYMTLILVSLAAAFISLKVLGRGLPSELGVALMLGFATVNILSTQTKQITNAQKARGYDVQPKNLIERVKVLTALMIPILLTTLERSQDISIAILSRGFDYNIRERTYRRNFIFQRTDLLVIAFMLLILVGGLLLNQSGWGNFSENFLLKMLS